MAGWVGCHYKEVLLHYFQAISNRLSEALKTYQDALDMAIPFMSSELHCSTFSMAVAPAAQSCLFLLNKLNYMAFYEIYLTDFLQDELTGS